MKNRTFEEIIKAYDQRAEGLKEKLGRLLAVVADRRIPSVADMQELEKEVDRLVEEYNNAVNFAFDQVKESELPSEGSSLDQFVEAVKKSRIKLLEQKRERARKVIERFIGVTSCIKEYRDALAPYQEEARRLLEQVGEMEPDSIDSKTEAPGCFLQALDTNNIGGVEGFKLMEAVNRFYSNAIQWGLMGRQYFYDENTQQCAVKAEREALVLQKADPEPEAGNFQAPDTEPEAKPVRTQAVESSYDGSSSSAETEPEMISAVNKVKIEAVRNSTLKSKTMKLAGFNAGVRVVLPLMTIFGIMTREQIRLFGACMGFGDKGEGSGKKIDRAVDILAAEGLIGEFRIMPEGKEQSINVYCLTQHCLRVLTSKEYTLGSMKKIWEIPFGQVKTCTKGLLNKAGAERFIRNNDTLLHYLQVAERFYGAQEFRKIRQSVRWRGEHYDVVVIYGGETQKCSLINQYSYLEEITEQCILIDADDMRILEKTGMQESMGAQDETGEPEEMYVPSGAGLPDADKIFVIKDGHICLFDRKMSEEIIGNFHSREEVKVKFAEMDNSRTGQTVTDGDEKIREKPGDEPGEKQKDSFLTLDEAIERSAPPSDKEFIELVLEILNRGAGTDEEVASAVADAVLLAKGAGLEEDRPESRKLSAQLCLGTKLLLGEGGYTSEILTDTFDNPGMDNNVLMLSAYMYAMLCPEKSYDYRLKNQAESYFSNYETYFADLPAFKSLFRILVSVGKEVPAGFTPASIALLGSDAESEKFLDELKAEAVACLTVPVPKARMKALPNMYNACFGKNSELYGCMEIIIDNRKSKEELELVEDILAEYCDVQGETYTLSNDKMEEKLTAAWDKANPGNHFKLEYDARDQALRLFRIRLKVMLDWRDHIHNLNNKKDVSRLKKYKEQILEKIGEIGEDFSWKKHHNANVLSWMLIYMRHYLNGRSSKLTPWSEHLYTGIFTVSGENGIPVIDESLARVRFYEIWRNALRHIAAEKPTAEAVRAEIVGDGPSKEDGLKDNLHQLEMLGKYIGSASDDYVIKERHVSDARRAAEDCRKKFTNALELAYTYDRINETQKENLYGLMKAYQADFYEKKDFACWRRFLEALNAQIGEYAERRQRELRARLDRKLEDEKNKDSRLLKEAERLLEQEMNFAVAEEFLNRSDLGETEIDGEILHDTDYFRDFLSDSVYKPLLEECRRHNGQSLKNFAWRYIEKSLPQDWTNRQREDSRTMVENWPVQKDSSRPEQVKKLFECLGLDVVKAEKVMGRKEEQFRLTVRPTAKSMADYRHPIAAFGTQTKSPVNVVILYGNYMPKQLVDTISSLDLGGMTVVLIDRAYDGASRRMIGEIFHTQTSGQNSFLLVDYVLFLYLAMHQITERLPALLCCTLPYSTYQPFVRDGGSTADEMFCGRTSELATIIDPNGACVVYGGRQLGKTALLQRAESRCNKPVNKAFAIYVSILDKDSEREVVKILVEEVNGKSDGKLCLRQCETLMDFCSQIQELFRKGEVSSLLLLIDEVDDFLASIAGEAYKPIQPLVDLKRETKNNFKFVIAGLHNVFRARNATKENGIFGQLGMPLCIKPLSPANALQLLSRPLRYLGFRVDRYPHLETILTKTNYYPGILQFFGYMLVETLSGQYATYYHAADGNPPFTLQEEQLGAVMSSADLNRSIKKKFQLSLELDARYFMIARCITMLYHYYNDDILSGGWLGFQVEAVMEMSSEYQIRCLEKESRSSYIVLMDEMCEMGILSMPKEGLYRLRRSSFVAIIGEDLDRLEADIIENNREEQA